MATLQTRLPRRLSLEERPWETWPRQCSADRPRSRHVRGAFRAQRPSGCQTWKTSHQTSRGRRSALPCGFSPSGWNNSQPIASTGAEWLEEVQSPARSSSTDRFLRGLHTADCNPELHAFGGDSMARLAINASPFQCRWISPGAEMLMEQWAYAICERCRDHLRVVSEDECGRCACWEPQTDGACHSWARAHHGVRRFPFRM